MPLLIAGHKPFITEKFYLHHSRHEFGLRGKKEYKPKKQPVLVCPAQPEVHVPLEHKQLQTSYRNLPISNYQKTPQLSKQILLSSVSHTGSMAWDDFADCYRCLSHSNKCCTWSVSVLLSICPQRSQTEEAVGDYWTVDVWGQSKAESPQWKMWIPEITSILVNTDLQNPCHYRATEVFKISLGLTYK